MIRVEITKKEHSIVQITISGHSYSAKSGRDLICAGVSASSVGTLNALVKFGFLENQMGSIEMKEGYIDIIVNRSTDTIQVILETLVAILETIAEDNQKYIKITTVEV